jgi:hypothetical protein
MAGAWMQNGIDLDLVRFSPSGWLARGADGWGPVDDVAATLAKLPCARTQGARHGACRARRGERRSPRSDVARAGVAGRPRMRGRGRRVCLGGADKMEAALLPGGHRNGVDGEVLRRRNRSPRQQDGT